MHDPAGRDATVVRKALSGDVIGLQVATEVICSRTSSQIQVFKQAYYARYGLHLENDIDYQASGDHQKVTFTFSSCLEVLVRTCSVARYSQVCCLKKASGSMSYS